MPIIRRFLIIATVVFAGLAGPGLALAAGSALPTSSTITYHFTDCTGPAGTPTTFDAVKQPGGAAALHIVGGGGIFVAMEAIDLASGQVLFSTPGFEHNDHPTVRCHLLHPVTLTLQLVTGIITGEQ
jgi:hypothetical protein